MILEVVQAPTVPCWGCASVLFEGWLCLQNLLGTPEGISRLYCYSAAVRLLKRS